QNDVTDVTIRDQIEQLVIQLKARISQTVRPIISRDALTRHPSPKASCILLKARGRGFMVSAAHVFDKLAGDTLLVLSKDGFVQLNGPFISTSDSAVSDKLDLAMMSLPSESYPQFEDADFLPLTYADTEEITTRDHLYTAFGFPISRVIPSDTKTHFT